MIGGTVSAAVSPAATASFASAVRQRAMGFARRKTTVPSSISEPMAAVPKTSATSGSTVRITSVSRISGASLRPPPRRMSSPTNTGRAASSTISSVRRRPSSPRNVTPTSAPKAVIGLLGPGSRTRSRANRRSG